MPYVDGGFAVSARMRRAREEKSSITSAEEQWVGVAHAGRGVGVEGMHVGQIVGVKVVLVDEEEEVVVGRGGGLQCNASTPMRMEVEGLVMFSMDM